MTRGAAVGAGAPDKCDLCPFVPNRPPILGTRRFFKPMGRVRVPRGASGRAWKRTVSGQHSHSISRLVRVAPRSTQRSAWGSCDPPSTAGWRLVPSRPRPGVLRAHSPSSGGHGGDWTCSACRSRATKRALMCQLAGGGRTGTEIGEETYPVRHARGRVAPNDDRATRPSA